MARQEQEPSVEDILASIKKVMAADAARPASPRSAPARPGHKADDAILELTETVEDTPGNAGEPQISAQTGDASLESLIDSEAGQSVQESLAALSTLAAPGRAPQIVRSGETSLEGLVREMLRPMLKSWLDQNLPDLVEELVAKEISRITQKRG